MHPGSRIGIFVFVCAGIVGLSQTAFAAVIQSPSEAAEFPQATLACKVTMGEIAESEAMSDHGTKCDSTCDVISTLKGDVGKKIRLWFRRYGNGYMWGADIKAGKTYIVMLKGDSEPYQMYAAMSAVDRVVPLDFGTKPGDRLMAELAAMAASDDSHMRIAAVEQIGIMREPRGSKEVNAAAKSDDVKTAREGVIAQYRMKIAPDAKRVMQLFDERIMSEWYEDSGIPQQDEKGKNIWRAQSGRDNAHVSILERGLPDFDYATYVREGIKKEWVRKDDHTLYVFFGVPWKVQRKACVPVLIELLDDPDKNVRRYAVLSLRHTVDDNEGYWEEKEYEGRAAEDLEKWRKWWKEKGDAFMTEPVPQR